MPSVAKTPLPSNNLVMSAMLPALFSLLTAAAGWHYMFYSRAAARLGAVEGDARNRRRVSLRRVGGLAMFILAILFCAGFYTVDADRTPGGFYLVWMGVVLMLVIIMCLALVDVGMTFKLRRAQRKVR